MKNIGVVRNLDLLGRVVLPAELRRILDFEEGQAVEIHSEGELIMIKKYRPGCHCCGETKIEAEILGIKLCDKCINEFAKVRKQINELR